MGLAGGRGIEGIPPLMQLRNAGLGLDAEWAGLIRRESANQSVLRSLWPQTGWPGQKALH